AARERSLDERFGLLGREELLLAELYGALERRDTLVRPDAMQVGLAVGKARHLPAGRRERRGVRAGLRAYRACDREAAERHGAGTEKLQRAGERIETLHMTTPRASGRIAQRPICSYKTCSENGMHLNSMSWAFSSSRR